MTAGFARAASTPLAVVVVAISTAIAVTIALAPPASATDLILEGPHPFVKENALSLNYLLGTAVGESFGGQGVGLGYGYMLTGPLWLDLQLNVRGATCSPPSEATCGHPSGSDAEILAGLSWRVQTQIPLVPFARVDAGPIFLYPDGSPNAMGLAARAGLGARYYVFDWLGFGAEVALSLGHGFFAEGYAWSRTYAVVDVGLGTEIQFE